ncbi:hypothetical protein AHMF7605_11600 [Adhaeribacter arboris]|uniref:HNH nuclease domain-containing protein n=1 Tax=Adhaeribacter arboris TaxID=2072846 RepID=A0A2T2YF19_9BACT|nr:HNH endonuclease [Adhaeribacter arboris]PSR54116.1 hypothetical protein AHMF7605_11600 [Adhaeribacter arboris]
MVDNYSRYQKNLNLEDLFPVLSGVCACGCGNLLDNPRKKWYSNKCRDNSYIQFAIIKGNTGIIRKLLYQLDQGACRNCGVITPNWQADHILPVSNGGGACGISNFQTLCQDCHKEKTNNMVK